MQYLVFLILLFLPYIINNNEIFQLITFYIYICNLLLFKFTYDLSVEIDVYFLITHIAFPPSFKNSDFVKGVKLMKSVKVFSL